ncbi:MAG: hypothetical protein KGO22_17590 [Gammaproteobacteria bacterium]|nr:hypothetical protein [Gammaproteobacteria bacterium]
MSLFSRESQPGLVVRQHAPVRRMILTATLALIVLVGLYAAFEFGRYYAGYSVVSVMQERARLNGSITELKNSNQTLKSHIISLETATAGHAREDQVVSRTIGELQAQVARQTEELAFYRAVVAEGAPAIGVRVGTVRLAAAKPPGNFLVHVSLVRAGKTDGMTTGTVSLAVDGQDQAGRPATLDAQALAAAGTDPDVTYDFRYYQDVDQTVTLPAGFRPEHVTVQVSSNRKDVAPLTQTFPWSAVAVP